MKISETKTLNLFDLRKGPIIGDSLSFDDKSSGILEEMKKKEFTEYNFKSDLLSTSTSFEPEKSSYSNPEKSEILNANIGEQFNFFTKKENTGGLMNAFTHQGEKFNNDPFKFNAGLPDVFEPFKFTNNQEKVEEEKISSFETKIKNEKKPLKIENSSIFFNLGNLEGFNNTENFSKKLPNFLGRFRRQKTPLFT